MNLVMLPPAKEELREAKEYYDKQRQGLGDEFLDAIEDAGKRIKQFPRAWSKLSDKVWRCRTNRFPYGLVYCVDGENILVLAVMHLRRKPNYWRSRLNDLPPPG